MNSSSASGFSSAYCNGSSSISARLSTTCKFLLILFLVSFANDALADKDCKKYSTLIQKLSKAKSKDSDSKISSLKSLSQVCENHSEDSDETILIIADPCASIRAKLEKAKQKLKDFENKNATAAGKAAISKELYEEYKAILVAFDKYYQKALITQSDTFDEEAFDEAANSVLRMVGLRYEEKSKEYKEAVKRFETLKKKLKALNEISDHAKRKAAMVDVGSFVLLFRNYLRSIMESVANDATKAIIRGEYQKELEKNIKDLEIELKDCDEKESAKSDSCYNAENELSRMLVYFDSSEKYWLGIRNNRQLNLFVNKIDSFCGHELFLLEESKQMELLEQELSVVELYALQHQKLINKSCKAISKINLSLPPNKFKRLNRTLSAIVEPYMRDKQLFLSSYKDSYCSTSEKPVAGTPTSSPVPTLDNPETPTPEATPTNTPQPPQPTIVVELTPTPTAPPTFTIIGETPTPTPQSTSTSTPTPEAFETPIPTATEALEASM